MRLIGSPLTPGDEEMNRFKVLVCLTFLALPGCGGPAPVLDATDDGIAEATLKAMTPGMSEAERKGFREDCDIAVLPAQYEQSTPGKGSKPPHKLKSLHGLTVDQIREKAAVLRAKLSQ
jgi:hypothetical protein